jgi:CubicO group peptidase (beta-lactamase class C family)
VHPADQPAPDPDAFLRRLLARHRKLRFEPGSRASYSNLGPLVLAAALATATGRPFTDLVAAEILGLLGWAPPRSASRRVRRPDDGRLTTEAGTRSWSPDQQRDPCHRLRAGPAPAD